MDIRPEAETIASKLPNAHRVFIVGSITEITQFLSEQALQPWAPFPVTALTNVIAAAADRTVDDDAVAQTCIRYLEDTDPGTMAPALANPPFRRGPGPQQNRASTRRRPTSTVTTYVPVRNI